MRPYPIHGGQRDAERPGGLFGGEAAEEAQRDQAPQRLIEPRRLVERPIDLDQVEVRGAGGDGPSARVTGSPAARGRASGPFGPSPDPR